jgi:hypothetical protein
VGLSLREGCGSISSPQPKKEIKQMKREELLIQELRQISKQWRSVGLLLAFPEKTIMVAYKQPNVLETLRLGLESGGKAIAWYGTNDGRVNFKLRPEYADQKWAREYLERAVPSIRERAKSSKGPESSN